MHINAYKVKPNSGDTWWSREKMNETNAFKHFMILSNEIPVLLDPTFWKQWAKCSSSLKCFCLSLASRRWLVLYGYYELVNQCALIALFTCVVYINIYCKNWGQKDVILSSLWKHEPWTDSSNDILSFPETAICCSVSSM